MSKLKNEDMEQDALIEYSTRFLHYYRNNKAVVWGGVLSILLIIGSIIGFVVYSNIQESEAEQLLGTAEDYYMYGDYERALYGDEAQFTLGFTQIADNYPRTSAGNLANYYAAVSYFELDQPEEALNHLNRFNNPSGILGVGPISLHAVILAELERYEDAAQKFIEAAMWDENNSTTPYNLLEAAVSFEAAGNTDRAIEQLDIILQEYPNSPLHTEAERMRGQLTVRS